VTAVCKRHQTLLHTCALRCVHLQSIGRARVLASIERYAFGWIVSLRAGNSAMSGPVRSFCFVGVSRRYFTDALTSVDWRKLTERVDDGSASVSEVLDSSKSVTLPSAAGCRPLLVVFFVPGIMHPQQNFSDTSCTTVFSSIHSTPDVRYETRRKEPYDAKFPCC